MDLGSIFLILALLTLVALYITHPFFQKTGRRSAPASSAEQHYSALMAEHDRILNALAELDFDHVVGKIPEEDYPSQRLGLLKSGAEVLRQLDAYRAAGAGDRTAQPETAEARIEAAIAARRAALSPALTAAGAAGDPAAQAAGAISADDDIEVSIANRRRARKEKSAGFCPQCGGPVQKSDRFCPKCGAKLA